MVMVIVVMVIFQIPNNGKGDEEEGGVQKKRRLKSLDTFRGCVILGRPIPMQYPC